MISQDDTRLLMNRPTTFSDQEVLAPFVCPKCGGHELCVQVSGDDAGDGLEVIYDATPADGLDHLVFVDWSELESTNATERETYPAPPSFASAWCDSCDTPIDTPDGVKASILRLWKTEVGDAVQNVID